MFHHRIDDAVDKRTFVKWYLLAFLAGNVNTGGFIAAERFVTHVTGFATLFGMEVAHARFDRAIGIATIPLFFLFGTMLSAYLVDRRFHLGKKPHYDWVMLLEMLCLVAVAVFGGLDFFGTFGDEAKLSQDYFFLALLCMAMGLQNAAITTASGASVRTTHLTGITTDLGIGLVRVWSTKRETSIHHREVRANWLRAGTIGSFIFGAVVGASLFLQFQYWGFLLPSALAFYAYLQARKEHLQDYR